MSFPVKNPRASRRQWYKNEPPKKYQILVEDAIAAAGNPNQLSTILGITRGAVYQWRPPYRVSPYIPTKAAVEFLSHPGLVREWRRIIKEREDE